MEINPSEKYSGRGHLTLADGLRGNDNFQDKKWLGFNGDNCVINIDMKEKKNISKIKIGYLSNPGSWIFPPQKIIAQSTLNREHFIPAAEWTNPAPATSTSQALMGMIEIEVDIKDKRRLQLIIENIGVCPEWHGGSGEKAWLFLDEIWVE